MSNLTKEQAKKYFDSCGNECPFCGSQRIFASSNVNFDCDSAWREVDCRECGESWKDQYRLTAMLHKGLSTEFENDKLIEILAKPIAPLTIYIITTQKEKILYSTSKPINDVLDECETKDIEPISLTVISANQINDFAPYHRMCLGVEL